MFDFFLPHAVILNLIQDLFLFFQKVFDSLFYHTTSSWTWFRISLLFFSKSFWFFSFLFLLYFYFFHKNYYHITKGKEPARSPKPAVSLPLNPSLLGHGSGLRPKNLPPSEVSSVSYEQIRVGIIVWRKKTLVLYWNKETPKFIWSSPRTVTKPPVSQLGRLYFFYSITF